MFNRFAAFRLSDFLLTQVLTIILSSCIFSGYSQNLSLAFANTLGSIGDDSQRAITSDSCGNLYVTGSFSGTVDFDPSTAVVALSTGNQQTNVFVAKYSSQGGLLWVKQFKANQWAVGLSIELDQNNNIGFTSSLNGIGDIDPGPAIVSVGVSNGVGQNVFVKLDPQGNLLFGFVIGGGLPGAARLIFGNNGDLIICGCFYGTVDLDAGTGTATVSSVGGTRDFFICRYTAAGLYAWGKKWGANGADRINDINLDNAGNILAIGNFVYTVDFDPGPAAFNLNMNAGEMYMFKLSGNGNFVWAKQYGSNGTNFQNWTSDIATDAQNNIYAVGHFSNTIDVDPSPSTYSIGSTGLHDCFFIKFNQAGSFILAEQFGGPGFDSFDHISLASNGDLFITGNFQQSMDFDPNATNYFLNAISFHDGFVLQLDNAANFANVYQFASNSASTSVYPDDLIIQPSGAIYLTGYFNGTADFDPSAFVQNQTSAGGTDAFLLKLSPCLDAPSKNCDIIHACARASVTLVPNGGNNLVWYDFLNQTSVGSGQIFVTPILPAGTYSYYASASTCTVPNNSAVFVVSVSPSPTLTVTPTVVNVCIGSVVSFSTSGASSYYWNNSTVATNSLASFVAASNTIFTVKGTDTITSCSNSKTVSINVTNCTGIPEAFAEIGLSIFPNPFQNEITVNSKTEGKAVLLDYVGRQIAHIDFGSGTSKYVISDIAPGVYFFRVNTAQSKATFRLIKE